MQQPTSIRILLYMGEARIWAVVSPQNEPHLGNRLPTAEQLTCICDEFGGAREVPYCLHLLEPRNRKTEGRYPICP